MKCPHFVINMRAFTNLSNISFLHWYLSRLAISHMSNSSFMFWMRKKRKRRKNSANDLKKQTNKLYYAGDRALAQLVWRIYGFSFLGDL